MEQDSLQPKKQAQPAKDLEAAINDLRMKYDELMEDYSMLAAEKLKWKETINEFDEFYNDAPCGFKSWDENGLIFKMNNTELKLLGYTREEVINKMNLFDLYAEKDAALFYKNVSIIKQKGHISKLDVDYVRKDGTLVSVIVNAKGVFDDNGNLKFVNSIILDVTDRKKMEDEMLKATRQASVLKARLKEEKDRVLQLNDNLKLLADDHEEAYNAAKTNIAAPLQEVSAICNQLLSALAPGAEQQQPLMQIQKIVKEINSYVHNMQLKQSISTNNVELRLAQCNLSGLLVNVVKNLENIAAQKRLTINCEIYENISIRSDEDLLQQVMNTLLSVVIKLAIPGVEIPFRLIHKINEYIIELEIVDLSFNKEELADYIEEYSNEPESGADAVLDSMAINSLVEKLGCTLTVSPFNHKGTLIRLLIPVKA